MIIRNLDSLGDWSFGNGLSNYLVDNEAIGLNIKTRIFSWLGDCFFDTGAGIDWPNRLGNENQRSLLELDLRRIVLQSYGVTGIVTFNAELVGRKFTTNFSVNTIFSQGYEMNLAQEIG